MKPARLLALIAPLLVAACGTPSRGDTDAGGETGEGGGGGGGLGGGAVSMTFSAEAYCTSLTSQACQLAVKCDNETLFDDRHGGDLVACKAALMPECTAGILPYERGVAAGALNYSGADLNDCLNVIKDAECSAAAQAWGLLSCERGGARECDRWFLRTALEETCLNVFRGTVVETGACFNDVECAPGHWCNLARCGGENKDRPGACERRLPRGEPCSTTPLGCAEGMICAGTNAQFRKCKPLAVQDEECTLDDPAGGGVSKPNCLPPLHCISGTGGQQGGGVGGSFGTCQKLSRQLEACGQGRAKCEPDSYCDFKSTGSIQGDCQPFKAEEEECKDDADPRQCGAGMYCFATGNAPGMPGRPKPDGRCEKYQDVEGLCVKNHSNCLEGWCPADAPSWQGFCEPFKETNEDCSASYQCGSGNECRQNSATGTKVCAPSDVTEGLRCVRPDPS